MCLFGQLWDFLLFLCGSLLIKLSIGVIYKTFLHHENPEIIRSKHVQYNSLKNSKHVFLKNICDLAAICPFQNSSKVTNYNNLI